MAGIQDDLQMFSQQAPPTEKEIKAIKAVNRAAQAAANKRPKASAVFKKAPGTTTTKKKTTTRKKATPKKPTAAKKKEDDIQEKDKIVRKLERYMERFGTTKLKDINFKLPTCQDSMEVIKEAELVIERRLGEEDGKGFVVIAHVGVCQMIDKINPMQWKVPNMLTTTAVQPENMKQIEPLLDEISIKYGHLINRSVEFRYIATMFNLMMSINRVMTMQNKEEPILTEEEMEQHKDL